MSIAYRPLKEVPACELFDGRLQEFGVREDVNDRTDENKRCLTDDRNYLWLYITNGFVNSISRYGGNAAGKILGAIEEAFDTYIVSEGQPQFWGFDTQEEFDAAIAEIWRKSDDSDHVELMKYLAGEPNNIRPGTIGMIWAEIAKGLVEKDSSLLLPENRDRLHQEIRSIYDLGVVVNLTPEDCVHCGWGGAELDLAYWPTAPHPVRLHRSCADVWRAVQDALFEGPPWYGRLPAKIESEANEAAEQAEPANREKASA